jgi:hypothetical protein
MRRRLLGEAGDVVLHPLTLTGCLLVGFAFGVFVGRFMVMVGDPIMYLAFASLILACYALWRTL